MSIKSFFAKLFGGNESESSGSCCCAGHKNTSKPAQGPTLNNLEDFVEYVAKSLVDYPDEVKVSTGSSENGKMIRISCRPEDRGKIIGKKGKTIMALRSLVSGAAGRLRDRVSVEVLDEEVNG